MRIRIIPVLALSLVAIACSSRPGSGGGTVAAAKGKFRAYDIVDQKQGGLVVDRMAVPADWKGSSRVVWNYNNFYVPVQVSARTESADGSSWIEFYPYKFFIWLDPAHDHAPIGPNPNSGIHQPNITLPEAMVRYIIAPSRPNAKNLRILGYRPVNNLERAFPKVFDASKPFPKGEAICMRVSYQLDGSPVDEEFYGFMTAVQTLYSPNHRIAEYHRLLLMPHSMGAKSGKLESVRPLLGFVATSIEPNPAWNQRLAQIKKMQTDYYDKVQAYNRAEVANAARKSEMLTQQENQFMARIDANLAQSRAQQAAPQGFSSSSTDDFYKRADDFDQNIRGTEHMQDQYGQVSDQYTDYNYHWTNGFGDYVHTNDPNFDPNRYLTGSYEKMTPAPR